MADTAATLSSTLYFERASADRLRRAMVAPAVALRDEALLLTAKACVFLLSLILASDLARWGTLRLTGSLRRDFRYHDLSDVDVTMIKRLSVFGAVVAAVVGLIAVAVLLHTDVGLDEFVHLVKYMIAGLAGLSIVVYATGLRRYSRHDPMHAHKVAEYLAHPHRRARLWIGGFFTLLMCVLFIDAYLPWLFHKFWQVPGRIRSRAEQVLSDAEIEALRLAAVESVGRHETHERAESAGRALAERLKGLRMARIDPSAGFDVANLSNLRGELRSCLAAVSVWLTLGVLCSPLLVRPHGSASWRDRLKAEGGTWSVIAAGMMVLPVSFTLDWMGVTSARPLLWLFIFVPLAAADVLSASRTGREEVVHVVIGAERYHTQLHCSAVKRVSADRIRSCDRAVAQRLGYLTCRLCERSPKRRSQPTAARAIETRRG